MTDEEKIEFLATKAMRWRKIRTHFPEWNPLASLSDAWMVVEKAVEMSPHNPEIINAIAELGVYGMVAHYGYIFNMPEAKAARAICDAAIEAVKGGKNEESD